jgi:glycosyltransferase involved in cell wall biosynthesis
LFEASAMASHPVSPAVVDQGEDRVRVLFIARDFPPISHSGTVRSEAFARYLPDFGVDPVIFTAAPEHATRMAGLDQVCLDDWQDDPRWPAVYRAPWTSGLSGEGAFRGWLKRLPAVNILTSQAGRRRTVTALRGRAREAVRSHGVRAIYASVMPSETLLLAIELGREFNLPVIADVRDPWTYHPSAPYRHILDFLLERRLERSALSRCTRIIVNTRQSKLLLQDHLGVPPSRIQIIRNGYDEAEFRSAPATGEPLEPGKFVLLHAGQLSLGNPKPRRWTNRLKSRLGFDYNPLQIDAAARSPRYLLQALETLIERQPQLKDRLRLWLVGMNNSERCEAIQRFRFPECLRVVPRCDSATATELMRRADLLLLLQFQYFLKRQDYCVAIPAKLYSYLRSGRPILACVQPSEISEVLEEHGAGAAVHPHDVEGIAAAILAEYERWSSNPAAPTVRRKSIDGYERRHLTAALAEAIRACIADHAATEDRQPV